MMTAMTMFIQLIDRWRQSIVHNNNNNNMGTYLGRPRRRRRARRLEAADLGERQPLHAPPAGRLRMTAMMMMIASVHDCQSISQSMQCNARGP